jgi:hypothetical protein
MFLLSKYVAKGKDFRKIMKTTAENENLSVRTTNVSICYKQSGSAQIQNLNPLSARDQRKGDKSFFKIDLCDQINHILLIKNLINSNFRGSIFFSFKISREILLFFYLKE